MYIVCIYIPDSSVENRRPEKKVRLFWKILNFLYTYFREAAKKISLNGRAIKRGGGKGGAIKEKKTFFIVFYFVAKFQRPLREEFFAASLNRQLLIIFSLFTMDIAIHCWYVPMILQINVISLVCTYLFTVCLLKIFVYFVR